MRKRRERVYSSRFKAHGSSRAVERLVYHRCIAALIVETGSSCPAKSENGVFGTSATEQGARDDQRNLDRFVSAERSTCGFNARR